MNEVNVFMLSFSKKEMLICQHLIGQKKEVTINDKNHMHWYKVQTYGQGDLSISDFLKTLPSEQANKNGINDDKNPIPIAVDWDSDSAKF